MNNLQELIGITPIFTGVPCFRFALKIFEFSLNKKFNKFDFFQAETSLSLCFRIKSKVNPVNWDSVDFSKLK